MNKFAEACIASYKEWDDALPNIELLPEPEYSKKHNDRMNILFDKMRGDEYHCFTRKTLRFILVAAVVSALLLCAFAMPSSREFFVENFEDFSLFSITRHNGNTVPNIEVGYVPEGYELVEVYDSDMYMGYVYESYLGNTVRILKSSSSSVSMFNSEGGEIEKVTMDEITYTITSDPSHINYIVWIKNDYVYSVDGEISKEELIKIAKNVK